MDSILDPELQRRIQITSLLQSGGWKLYQDKLADLKACYDAEVQQILASDLDSTKLALLANRLGKVQALSAVLATQDELLEEITPADGDTPEEVTQE